MKDATTAWSDERLCHGFLGRLGGVSRGPFASLNLSYLVGDEPGDVDANWRRLRAALLGNMVLAQLNQVHGNAVHVVSPGYDGARPRGDGLVTAAAGVAIGVFTADCVPILMVDNEAHVAGALHAGWRGILAGITDAGVAAMTKLGASAGKISAALGPAIGFCCFEVDDDLARRFEREIPGAGRHVRSGRPGKAFLDLKAIVAGQLERAGLDPPAISSVGPCTRCASERYFSRRAAGGGTTGLQLSFVGFKE